MNMEEEWRFVPGYENRYAVSSLGRMKSLQFRPGGKRIMRERILSPSPGSRGYMNISLFMDGHKKLTALHLVVASAFLPADPERLYINHKNGNKSDCRVENLERCTMSENAIHALDNGLRAHGSQSANAKLSEEQVKAIRQLAAKGLSERKLAARFAVSRSTITHIKKGIVWRRCL